VPGVYRSLSPSLARRLMITCQRLAGPRPAVTAETLLDGMCAVGPAECRCSQPYAAALEPSGGTTTRRWAGAPLV
jgi:hypothetical protein